MSPRRLRSRKAWNSRSWSSVSAFVSSYSSTLNSRTTHTANTRDNRSQSLCNRQTATAHCSDCSCRSTRLTVFEFLEIFELCEQTVQLILNVCAQQNRLERGEAESGVEPHVSRRSHGRSSVCCCCCCCLSVRRCLTSCLPFAVTSCVARAAATELMMMGESDRCSE